MDVRERLRGSARWPRARAGAKAVRTDRLSHVADRENVALVKIATVSAAVWAEAERTDELSE